MKITYDNFEKILETGLQSKTVCLAGLDWIEPVGIAVLKTLLDTGRITGISGSETVDSKVKWYINSLTQPIKSFDHDKSYVALTEFSKDLFHQSEDGLVKLTVDKILKSTSCLKDYERDDLRKYLLYLLGEIVRNIKDHSNSEHSYICAQFYNNAYNPKKTQVVIIDSGIGLLASLRSRYQDVVDHVQALDKATQPFVTRVAPGPKSYGQTTNIGIGLHMSTQLIKLTNNRFKMISGNGILSIEKGNVAYRMLPFDWGGTIVTFEILEENLVQEFGELFEHIRSLLPKGGETIF